MNKCQHFQVLPLPESIYILLGFVLDNTDQRKRSKDNGLNCNRTDKNGYHLYLD